MDGGAIGDKPSYGDKEGAWVETSSEEIEKLIALIYTMACYMLAHFTNIGAQNLYTMGCGHGVLCPKTNSRHLWQCFSC